MDALPDFETFIGTVLDKARSLLATKDGNAIAVPYFALEGHGLATAYRNGTWTVSMEHPELAHTYRQKAYDAMRRREACDVVRMWG